MLQQPKWFSDASYYADKLTQLKAMGHTEFKTADEVKAAIEETYGSAWAHFNQVGYKETYLANDVVQYIPLRDSAGKVVFDPQAYCTSKLEQLNGVSSSFKGKFKTWQEVAQAIAGEGMNIYEHYYSFGQQEGLTLNAGFNSGNFFKAKLAYLQSHQEQFPQYKDWGLQELKDFFSSNGMDAYSNWLEFGAAEGITQAMVEVGGSAVFELTTGHDNITGTSGNDLFKAYILGDSNTLNTGDKIDGGAGKDTLEADITDYGFSSALTPITNNVEIVKFRVQESHKATGDNNVWARIDAERMLGVQEFWSQDSRADLRIEDVRIDSNKVTVGMQNTDPGTVDYEFYFNPQHIKSDDVETTGILILKLIDTQGELKNDQPLLDNPFDTIRFMYGGELKEVTFDKISGATATYKQLADAIQAGLEAAGLGDIKVTLGEDFTQYDGLSGDPVTGTSIILTGAEEMGIASGNAWEASAGFPADTSVSATMTQQLDTGCPLYQTDVALDNVGRVIWDDPNTVCLPDNAIYGSRAGDLVIGSMATRGGIERFDVTVDRGSWLNSLSSTNNTLRMITVDDKDWNGDGVEDGGPLFIGRHKDTFGDDYMDEWAFPAWSGEATNRYDEFRFLGGGKDWGGIWDVKNFDSSAYSGNVNISATFTAEAYDKYLTDVDGLRTIYAESNYAPAGEFAYTFGKGDDTLNMSVNGGIVADRDFILQMNMGEGNDWVNFTNDFQTANQAIDQKNLKNVSIDTGAGDDKVWTWVDNFTAAGWTNQEDQRDHSWSGATGHVTINAGSGDDVVYAAQSTNTNATWVLNANTLAASDTDPLAINFGAVGQAQPLMNNVSSTINEYTITNVAAGDYNLFAVVNFLGIQAECQIGRTNTVATDKNSYSVDAEAINKAIITAIEKDSQLKHLLSAFDGAGKSLLVQSLIDGEYSLDDFGVTFYHKSVAATPATTWVTADMDAMGAFVNQAHYSGFGAVVGTQVFDVTGWPFAAPANSMDTYEVTFNSVTLTATPTGTGFAAWADVVAALVADATNNYPNFGYTIKAGAAAGDLTFTSDSTTIPDGSPLPTPVTFGGTAPLPPAGAVSTPRYDNLAYINNEVAGYDSHSYGTSVINGGDGADMLVTGYTDATVNAGAGNDTIVVGNLTYNSITGGTGADTIILGHLNHTNAGMNGNNDVTGAYDVLYQGVGDSGKLGVQTTGNIATGSFDVIHNFDTTASAVSDRLVISSYKTSGTTNLSFDTARIMNNVANVTDLTATANQNGAIRAAHGRYDDYSGTFVIGNGSDMIIAYDADATSAVSWEAVILTGVGATATVAANEAANGDFLTITA